MSTLVSPDKKVFDDTLEDLGGVCLFDYTKERFGKDYSFFKPYDSAHWDALGRGYYGFEGKSAYIRFVDPQSERFGSIARIVPYSWSSQYQGRYTKASDIAQAMRLWSGRSSFYGECRWNKRSSKPSFSVPSDKVEYLPNYTGDTIWKFDRDRKQRVEFVAAHDRLGRLINVGDFITYILYQFDGSGAAGIYFGNVTKVDLDGSVWAKNVGLSSSDRVGEKKIKDNKLITILTDDLMRQLMLAKLSNG